MKMETEEATTSSPPQPPLLSSQPSLLSSSSYYYDPNKPITHIETRGGTVARVGDFVYVSDTMFIALIDSIYFQKNEEKSEGETRDSGVWMFKGKWVYRYYDLLEESRYKMNIGREPGEREVFPLHGRLHKLCRPHRRDLRRPPFHRRCYAGPRVAPPLLLPRDHQ